MPVSFNKPLQSGLVFLEMNRCFLAAICLFITTALFSQSDFIQLKKGNKVVQTWYKDDDIYLQLKNNQWVNAAIYKIQDDSLYLRPYLVQTFANRIGLPYLDTTYFGIMAVHINNIKAFPKEKESFSYIKNGTLFTIAGGGYLLLNIINTLSDGDAVFGSDNIDNLCIGAGLLTVGLVLGLTHKSTYIIGKKYRIEYIGMKPSS